MSLEEQERLGLEELWLLVEEERKKAATREGWEVEMRKLGFSFVRQLSRQITMYKLKFG